MNNLSGFDQSILQVIHRLPAVWQPLMVFVTTFGSPTFCAIAVAAIAIWAWAHRDRQLAFMHIVVLLALPLGAGLQQLVQRARPDTPYTQDMFIHTYSFPSEHAYASFLVYGLFACVVSRRIHSAWRWPIVSGLMVMILLVGLSRVYLGAHYPSDVLGGWLLGAIILYAALKLSQALLKTHPRPK